MDETQSAVDFSAQVDTLLQHGSVPTAGSQEQRELLQIAQTLAAVDFSHESHHSRLPTAPLQRRHPSSWLRPAFAVGFTMLLAISLVWSIPPLRTLAQEMIKRLQTFALSSAPSAIDRYLTATPTNDPAHPSVTLQNTSLDQAIKRAGFTPLMPTYLPAGYVQTILRATENQISTEYQLETRISTQCCAGLGLVQLRAKPDQPPFPVGDVPITDVTIRGVHGLWVQNSRTGMTPDATGKPQLMLVNILTWEEDGFLFWLSSYDSQTNQPLSQGEMMKIAAALH